ncbi:MAG: DUF1028 domain-containing protein [Chloroflexi bacterium]|nr:DUF1028 domain-containing protein [Chloroflexota bacterium]
MQTIATFSIVAYDPDKQEWGVAVQSKFLGVGAFVCFARAGAGAVATQAQANMAYGTEGLVHMQAGMPAEETIHTLTAADEQRAVRQVGMVDKTGNSASFTGEECHEWAGHLIGEGFTCQGNILIPGTIEAIAAGFEQARKGDGELSDWLVEALSAGQEAGGDKRGRQAAAVLVVRENGGYGGNNDRYMDLRVDDDPYPIKKLRSLVDTHHLFFGAANPEDIVPLNEVAADIQELLKRTGHYDGSLSGVFDEPTRKSLKTLVGVENLEERWTGEGDAIDSKVLDFLHNKFE